MNRKTIEKTRSCFFEKITKSINFYVELNKNRRPKVRIDEGDITRDTSKKQQKKLTKNIIRGCYKQLFENKLDNLEEMDKCLENIQPTKAESRRNRKPKQINSE